MLKILEPLSKRLQLQGLSRLQTFSTAVQPESQERTQSFRTTEDNPTKHTERNLAQFYKLKPEVKKQIFPHGGLTKSLEKQAKTFTETCFMVRQPALDIIDVMKNVDYEKPVVRMILYGKKGNGKSMTLAHVIHYGFEAGYLLVHVPWVGNWMRRCKESSNTENQEGFIDINLDAAAWLLHFKTQNSKFLSNPNFRTSKEYIWSKRETTSKGAPISELIEHGLNRVKYASKTVIALAQEIKHHANSGLLKALVAIDGANAFFYPKTRIFGEKKVNIPPEKVTITEAFLELTKFDWKNGIVVATVDEIASGPEHQNSHFPMYLLGKSGFEHFDPFLPIEVTEYTPKELKSCLDYYRERLWIKPTPGQDEELAFLSASNPYKLMQLCGPL